MKYVRESFCSGSFSSPYSPSREVNVLKNTFIFFFPVIFPVAHGWMESVCL